MKFPLPSNTFTDPQGTALAFTGFETSGANQTCWMTFNPTLDEFLGTPPASLIGTIGVQVVATDACGLSTPETFGVAFATSSSHRTTVSGHIDTEMLAFHQKNLPSRRKGSQLRRYCSGRPCRLNHRLKHRGWRGNTTRRPGVLRLLPPCRGTSA
jgi:hypothetical protein